MWLEESGSSNFCFKGKREDERKRARIGLGFCLLIFFCMMLASCTPA